MGTVRAERPGQVCLLFQYHGGIGNLRQLTPSSKRVYILFTICRLGTPQVDTLLRETAIKQVPKGCGYEEGLPTEEDAIVDEGSRAASRKRRRSASRSAPLYRKEIKDSVSNLVTSVDRLTKPDDAGYDSEKKAESKWASASLHMDRLQEARERLDKAQDTHDRVHIAICQTHYDLVALRAKRHLAELESIEQSAEPYSERQGANSGELNHHRAPLD